MPDLAIKLSTFAMHANDPRYTETFETLREERAGSNEFAISNNIGTEALDPETAASQYLHQALESQAVPSLTTPQADNIKSEFKPIGTETLPLTNTRTVKFRQTFNKIPVYSSLVTVELDKNNEFLAINSALGNPEGVDPIAKISPEQAIQSALSYAGDQPPAGLTPRLNYYLDKKAGRWRLVYIIEDVPVQKEKEETIGNHIQFYMDYVIDAGTGELVAELPRTPTMAGPNQVETLDGLSQRRLIRIKPDVDGGGNLLHDETLNIQTYDFGFNDPIVRRNELPGEIVKNPPDPWQGGAISAHANAAAVAEYLQNVLRRNNIDNRGGPLVSTVNCVVTFRNPLTGNQWFNAFWTPVARQMVYGQVFHGSDLRSLAVNLDVVGHEMFHGVTNDTARLEYQDQSGALNESYSDIFGILISNFSEPDVDRWNWQLGEGLATDDRPLRDLSRPSLHGQPEHMSEYVITLDDNGGVHRNSGIHNFAAFKIMTARNSQGGALFTPNEIAAMFYIALTQYLTRASDFADSRRAVLLAAQTLFRGDSPAALREKMEGLADAFTSVGIEE